MGPLRNCPVAKTLGVFRNTLWRLTIDRLHHNTLNETYQEIWDRLEVRLFDDLATESL